MDIDLVVFDMAGTTVDDGDAVARCFREALAHVGVDVDSAAANSVMGMPKPEAIRILVGRSPHAETLLGRVSGIHAYFVARMSHFYRTDSALREVPGTRSVFEALHRAGIKVALNSGFSRDIAAIIIERLGWAREGLIDASITSDEAERGRPHPDMIQKLMKSVGVSDPRRVMKVGDTPVDLQEGTNAGCGSVVGVTRGTHTRAQLEGYPHTDLVESVADIPTLLGL
jgi:phosphonatase-like hydrolase